MNTNIDGSYSFQEKISGLFLAVAEARQGVFVGGFTGSIPPTGNAQNWFVNWPNDPNGKSGYMQFVPSSSNRKRCFQATSLRAMGVA